MERVVTTIYLQHTILMRDAFAVQVAHDGDDAEIEAILFEVCQETRMGFVAVSRVTEDRWIAAQVVDRIEFGLHPGEELDVKKPSVTTFVNVAKQSLSTIQWKTRIGGRTRCQFCTVSKAMLHCQSCLKMGLFTAPYAPLIPNHGH